MVLKTRLMSEYYDVDICGDASSGWASILREPPDAILVNCRLPDANGYGFCAKVKSHPETGHIPVVLIATDRGEVSWSKAYSSFADDIHQLPLDFPLLVPRLQSLLRAKASLDELRLRHQTSEDLGLAEPKTFLGAVSLRQISVAIVGGETGSRRAMSDALRSVLGASITDLGRDWTGALDCTQETVVVLGRAQDSPEALRLIARLRSNRSSRFASVLFAGERNGTALAERALSLGANDAFCGDIDDHALAARVRAVNNHAMLANMLRASMSNSLRLAMVDPLTGLYNRRYAEQYLTKAIARAADTGRDLFALMLDLDNFKAINDQYGHAAGDRVLNTVAERLQGNLRGLDLVARVGGEEFLVVIADVSKERALEIAQRIRTVIGQSGFDVGEAQLPVTVSIGIARADPQNCNEAALLAAADRALYTSKDQGRDTVSFAA
jgi:two-component system cell cycle response regulator